jgi:hypothetical protein
MIVIPLGQVFAVKRLSDGRIMFKAHDPATCRMWIRDQGTATEQVMLGV